MVKEGWEDVIDNARSERPSISQTDENVTRVINKEKANRVTIADELKERVQIEPDFLDKCYYCGRNICI